jgi:hypothetical protein
MSQHTAEEAAAAEVPTLEEHLQGLSKEQKLLEHGLDSLLAHYTRNHAILVGQTVTELVFTGKLLSKEIMLLRGLEASLLNCTTVDEIPGAVKPALQALAEWRMETHSKVQLEAARLAQLKRQEVTGAAGH